MSNSKQVGKTYNNDIKEFVKSSHSILWRANPTLYNQIRERVAKIQEEHGYKYNIAFLIAAKDEPLLWDLFQQFDVREFDPDPESDPDLYSIPVQGAESFDRDDDSDDSVKNENIEQSHRENLNWAMATAGEFFRTKEMPKTYPNSAAYFLFDQAIKEPKDFLSRFNQIETKVSNEEGSVALASKRSISEIDMMLDTLNDDPDEEADKAFHRMST